MAYCIYLRKSRADLEAEAHGEGETLARHEKALVEFAHCLNLDMSAIYREIVSGETISARPIMQLLLNEVEQGLWDGVLVTEIERLARGDTIDQGIVAQAFKHSNTKIITPSKTYDPSNEFDEEYFEFGLFMSRREYKSINRRIQAGKLAASKEGKFVPGTPPYGYERVKLLNQKGFTLRPEPNEAETVRLIFDLFTKNHIKYMTICKKLAAFNIKPRNADYWHPNTIRGIIKNPVYIGKIVWGAKKTIKKVCAGDVKKRRVATNGGMVADGLHEPIISPEQWALAQKINAKKVNSHVTTKHKLQNPLTGLVFCGMCGNVMVRSTQTKGYPSVLTCRTPFCKAISHRLDYVEMLVLQGINQWLSAYKISCQAEEKAPESASLEENALKKINTKLNMIQKQLENAYMFLEQGIYEPDVFKKRSHALKTEKDQLLVSVSELIKSINDKKEHSLYESIEKAESFAKLYDVLTEPSAKNRLLKEILSKIEYTKQAGGSRTAPNIGIKLYVRLSQT